jgi:hypothetical protein
MIYLTNYIKFNESFNDRLDDIDYILLELTDKDFDVKQTKDAYNDKGGRIDINVSKGKRFTLNDVSDVLLRLFNYSKECRMDKFSPGSAGIFTDKNFYIEIETPDRINGAKVLDSITSFTLNGFSYKLNIGKDNRFYTPRSRLSGDIAVSKRKEILKVNIIFLI